MAEDLTQYIRAFKGILTTAKQYAHLWDNKDPKLEFCSKFLAPDETMFFYLKREENGDYSLGCKYTNALNNSLEQLAEVAVRENIQPKDLINSFCSALGKPLAKHLADAESKRLENQLLYLLEMPNQ